MCIDLQDQGVELWGTWTSDSSYRAFDIMAMPCGTYFPTVDGSNRINEDCVWDRDEFINWIGPFNAVIYYNSAAFRQNEFGDDRIRDFSALTSVQSDQNRPNYIATFIN